MKRRNRDELPFIWPIYDGNDPGHREGLLLGLQFRAAHLRSVMAGTGLNPTLRTQTENALSGLERRIDGMHAVVRAAKEAKRESTER